MLTYQDKETLNYLMHDKKHVMNGGRVQEIDNAILYIGKESNIKLYRGVSDKELEIILNGNNFNNYQSFSELKEVASRFGPNVITILPSNVKSLSLWEYGINDVLEIKNESISQYEMIDGDGIIELYNEEKEWIIPYNSTLKLVDADLLIFELI